MVVPCDTQLCDKEVATTEWQASGMLMAWLPAARQLGAAQQAAARWQAPRNWWMGPLGLRKGGFLVPRMLSLVVYSSSHLPASSGLASACHAAGKRALFAFRLNSQHSYYGNRVILRCRLRLSEERVGCYQLLSTTFRIGCNLTAQMTMRCTRLVLPGDKFAVGYKRQPAHLRV